MTSASLHLLDASALLALVFDEPGSEVVEPMLDSASIHSFNLAEVITKLLQKGIQGDPEALLASLQVEVLEEFSAKQAAACAKLHAATRSHGLSMGDCVCLSIAKWMGIIAVTAEREWEDAVAGMDIRVQCIR